MAAPSSTCSASECSSRWQGEPSKVHEVYASFTKSAYEPGSPARDGISEGTYYRWKAQYGGLEVSQLRRLRRLEEENRRLKQVVADLTLDNDVLTTRRRFRTLNVLDIVTRECLAIEVDTSLPGQRVVYLRDQLIL